MHLVFGALAGTREHPSPRLLSPGNPYLSSGAKFAFPQGVLYCWRRAAVAGLAPLPACSASFWVARRSEDLADTALEPVLFIYTVSSTVFLCGGGNASVQPAQYSSPMRFAEEK